MDYWARTFDWLRLYRLDLDSIWLADKIMLKLIAIKHINLACSQTNNMLSMAYFFKNIPLTLEFISISNLNSVGTGPLLRHGDGLRTFEIH